MLWGIGWGVSREAQIAISQYLYKGKTTSFEGKLGKLHLIWYYSHNCKFFGSLGISVEITTSNPKVPFF